MKNIKECKVFIASPGDVKKERDIVRQTCRQLSSDPLVRSHGISFRAIGWEDVFPAPGRPQEIINRLVDECDIFVCIFHKRLGTPSGKEDSGTLEEFLLAYDSWKNLKKPHILFYFKDVQVSSSKELKDPQLLKVLDLKDNIETDRLLLFGTFASPDDFRIIFTKHMKDWIAENTRPKDTSGKPSAKIPLEIPDTYRKWITEHSQHMDLDKLREKSDVILVKLPEIFVPIYANDPEFEKSEKNEMEGRQFAERSSSVDIEGLAAKYDYLLVEGVAGSGKTTLIKHMAYLMIQNEDYIGGDNFLPVLIFLKDLKGFDLSAGTAGAGDPPSAEKILSYYFKKTENGLNLELLEAFSSAGKAVFLIDGLDEIDAGLRETVAVAFGNLRNRHDKTKMIITGRPHGLDNEVIKRFGDRHVKILPFTMEQIEDFITRWFWHVYDPKSRIGKKTTHGMISDIKAHPGTEKLIDNPLMLTAICILYHDERELPDQRAELYKKFVNNLLFRRFKDDHERVHAFLKQLGFEMFTKGERGIDRSPAVSILGREYPKSGDESESDYRKRLNAKFDEIEPNCGLLTFQDGQYNFRHLTLQEFLTATAIVDRETDYGEAIKGYWGNDRYKEVIELYVGYLSIENKRWANKIVQEMLNHNDDKSFSRWRLAARALLDMHKDRREIDVVDLAAER
jgi:energy-coupling factor transporter ATP-binding protein EcfA2